MAAVAIFRYSYMYQITGKTFWENLHWGEVLGMAFLTVVALMPILPKEDWDLAPRAESKWLTYMNDSCEVKPNGYFLYLFDNQNFWWKIVASMESWHEDWKLSNPYQDCEVYKEEPKYKVDKLMCRSEIRKVQNRFERCLPIAKIHCHNSGYRC